MKRFFAADIRQAMRKVRDEFGPDAVILSNRRVDGGVEIVSAIDYDEALITNAEHENNNYTTPPFLSSSSLPKILLEPHKNTHFSTSHNDEKSFEIEEISAWKDEDDINPGYFSSLKNNKEDQDRESFQDMWLEIKALRGLLENQLSSLAWGELVRKHPQQVELFQRLMKLGLSATICRKVADKIPAKISQSPDIEALWRRALGVLAHEIPVLDDDVLTHGGIIALVGPTGVGKTTTAAKLAARYAICHGSRNIAMVTIDNYRIGAHEQLRSYGRILNIPVRVACDQKELHEVLTELGEKRLILIDTAGIGQRDARLINQLKILKNTGESDVKHRIKNYLVLSAATRLSGLNEVAEAFKEITPDGAILTKIDETTSLGSSLSVIIQHNLPIAYVCDGQRVPEDLHNARAPTLISRSVAIMQQSARVLEDEALTLTVEKVAAHAHI